MGNECLPSTNWEGISFARTVFFTHSGATIMLSRFRHILVPLDFSEKNQAALDVAFELAVTNEARVTLLHVIETLDLPDDPEVEQFVEHLRERADRELEFCAGASPTRSSP